VPFETQPNIVQVDVTPAETIVVPHEKAANLLATFWDRVFAEVNVANHVQAACGSVEGQEINFRADVGARSELGEKIGARNHIS
jgi:hypothetical protein